jgi:hypothetical protein
VFVEGVDFLLKLVCIKNYAKNKAFKEMHTKLDKRNKDPNKYLITNDCGLTISQVIGYYRSRWAIEVLFRDCKQHLSLGKCQAYKMLEPHMRHTAMVFFTYALLELIKSKDNSDNSTIGDLKRYLQNQHLVDINGQYKVIDVSQMKLNWNQVNRLTCVLDLNKMKLRETQYVLNFRNLCIF